MIAKIKKPNGFQSNASMKLPCRMELMERVEPQEGQGIEVAFFIRQTSTWFSGILERI